MKYSAIIFDLFGTLVDNFSSHGYEDALMEMALVLPLPQEEFKRAWFDSSRTRNIGGLHGLENRIEFICGKLGEKRKKLQIKQAALVRLEYIRQVMTPRSDAIEVLSQLREKGFKIGLISDCSHEIPVAWPKTPLADLIDVTVFSCLVGFKKPDIRMYQLAAERLGVPVDKCLYIGDGGSQELSGALKACMQPILIRLDAESTEKHLASREEWSGPLVHSLREVLAIVDRE